MLAVMPIFLSSQDGFWTTEIGLELLKRTVGRLEGAQRVSGVAVVSDNQTVLDAAERAGARGVPGQCAVDETPGCLVPGLMPALAVLNVDAGEPILVVDYRNTALTSEVADRAVATREGADKAVVLGVVEPRDNPCQLSAYYKVEGSGLVHYLDPDFDSASLGTGHAASLPFLFDWAAHGVPEPEPGTLYACTGEGFRLILRTFGGGAGLNGAQTLWYCEDSQTARRVFAATPSGFAVEGLGDPLLDGRGPVRVWSEDGGAARLNASGADMGAVLRIEPFDEHGLLGEQEGVADGDGFAFAATGGSGFVYTGLSVAEDEGFNVSLPFLPTGGDWEVDRFGMCLRADTHAPICGRQDFPEVLAVGGGLSVLTPAQIVQVAAGLTSGKVAYVLLAQEESVQLDDFFDYICVELHGSQSGFSGDDGKDIP